MATARDTMTTDDTAAGTNKNNNNNYSASSKLFDIEWEDFMAEFSFVKI